MPISQGFFRESDIAGTLGEVVIGRKKRAGKESITVFDSTGLAIQDLAIAHIAMQHGKKLIFPFPDLFKKRAQPSLFRLLCVFLPDLLAVNGAAVVGTEGYEFPVRCSIVDTAP